MGTIFRIKNDTLQPRSGGKVIKAAEYAVMVQSQNLLDEARARAEEIVREAEEEYTNEKERGYQDGLLEGKIQMAERMMSSIASSVDYLEEMETSVVDVVMESMRKLLGEMQDKDRVTAVVRKALSYVRGHKKVILKVAPEDLEAVRSSIDDILRDHPGIGYLDIASDARLTSGDCVMESELGVVDAGLETQLEGIRRAFLKRLKK